MTTGARDFFGMPISHTDLDEPIDRLRDSATLAGLAEAEFLAEHDERSESALVYAVHQLLHAANEVFKAHRKEGGVS